MTANELAEGLLKYDVAKFLVGVGIFVAIVGLSIAWFLIDDVIVFRIKKWRRKRAGRR